MKSSALMQLIVILLGPPGVGKGSQATILAKKLNIPHISTGDLFREHIKYNSSLGQKAQQYMEKGLLVEDQLVIDMLIDRIQKEDCLKGYILDGFPRTLAQAELLSKVLDGEAHVKVIELSAPDQIVIERLSGRLVCAGCGLSFHKTTRPPKNDLSCDACNQSLFQRKDDNESVILDRLHVYHSLTAPLLYFYHAKGVVDIIDCQRSFDAIADDIFNLLKVSTHS